MRDALFKGFTTFGQFQSSVEKIASNILAARLQKMVDNGIFTRNGDPDNKLKVHYQLTDKGRDLRDVLIAVGTWGSRHVEGTVDLRDKMKQSTT